MKTNSNMLRKVSTFYFFLFSVNTGGGTQIRTNHDDLRRSIESIGAKAACQCLQKKRKGLGLLTQTTTWVAPPSETSLEKSE